MMAAARETRRVVGISEFVVSADPDEILITYALGSCLGVAIHDPVARVGGLLHVMLPEAAIDTGRGASTPAKYVDTGVPLLFRSAYELGAKKERLIVKVAGGAYTSASEADDLFQIGKRNFLKLREVFWRNNVLITAQDVGGSASRTVLLSVGTGEVRVRSQGSERSL